MKKTQTHKLKDIIAIKRKCAKKKCRMHKLKNILIERNANAKMKIKHINLKELLLQNLNLQIKEKMQTHKLKVMGETLNLNNTCLNIET
jgi:hypothetical protein